MSKKQTSIAKIRPETPEVPRRERNLFSFISGVAGFVLSVPAAIPITLFLAFIVGKPVDTHRLAEPTMVIYLLASVVLVICMVIGMIKSIRGLHRKNKSKWMSTAGLVLSALGLVLMIVIICLLWNTTGLPD